MPILDGLGVRLRPPRASPPRPTSGPHVSRCPRILMRPSCADGWPTWSPRRAPGNAAVAHVLQTELRGETRTGGDRETHSDVIARERVRFGLRCYWRRRPSRDEMWPSLTRTGFRPEAATAHGPSFRDNQTGLDCGTGRPGSSDPYRHSKVGVSRCVTA